jgi:hypothetical protein
MHADEHIRYAPESPSVDVRIVILAGIGALLLVTAAIGFLFGIYQHSIPTKDIPPPQTFAEPRVTTSQAEVSERERLASEQRQRLDTWRWANAEHTLVQIPIDRAMQLLAQRGNDAWAPLLPSPTPALSSPTPDTQNATTAPGANSEPHLTTGRQP